MSEVDLCRTSLSVGLWCTRRIVFGVNGNGNWKNSNVPYQNLNSRKMIPFLIFHQIWKYLPIPQTCKPMTKQSKCTEILFHIFRKSWFWKKIPSWYVESSLSDKKDLEKVKLMVDWRHSNHCRFSVYYSLTNCIKSEPNHFFGLNRGWMNHHQFYRNYWTGLAWLSLTWNS